MGGFVFLLFLFGRIRSILQKIRKCKKISNRFQARIMADFDVVILGATGFTGKWVSREFNRQAAASYKWAICGRNGEKLSSLKISEGLDCEILIADAEKPATLDEVTSKCRLLVNCTGPYRILGEPVFKSCVKNGTDYLDLCGEPEFIEGMEMKYSVDAVTSGSIAICGCGFDSIPSEMGLNFIRKKFGGQVHSVEAFLSMDAASGYCGNATTWDCAVLGFGNRDALQALRKINKKPKLQYLGPSREARGFGSQILDVPGVIGRSVPFPGSDVSIVRRSQALFQQNSETPVRYHMYAVFKDLSTIISVAVGGLCLAVLSRFSFGQRLLQRFVQFFTFGTFSRQGPSLESIQNTSFSLHMVADGVDQEQQPITKHLKIQGPEPGYDATSKILVCAIRTLLEERQNISDSLGGKGAVTTTAYAFQNTSIVQRLEDCGISFALE